ncbi:MAG: bifunctional 1-(5-phosphoribosyl)-5-((5-phosphoribosylamino)methylideneamino)imidazole-4-carboxamide isomerase/phosphoribosylanthranilate isomerase PriA, partial [Actinobacteria bacterium]|nr:bifunctional 1-(5-phosphoribosyl)-5-((5-phosphoribosylamino)methylideneamino)imidazole-4-carboxamide isomerase/phosphoribosylanthranilate isomerase PriA [Actinomycetota bacterium]
MTTVQSLDSRGSGDERLFRVLPAIDISAGRSVRLTQGIVDSESFAAPEVVARDFIAAGARWLHVVDLDLARGSGENSTQMAQVVSVAHAAGVKVQVSGGIHTLAAVDAAFSAGADRVNLACEALHDPDLLARVAKEHADHVSVSLDVRGDALIARGSGTNCGSLAAAVATLKDLDLNRVVVTDIDADGALSGASLALVDAVAAQGMHVIASGGIATLADVRALASRVALGV